VESPVRSEIDPELPDDAIPDFRDRPPLIPESAAWPLVILNAPEDVLALDPVIIETAPPLAVAL
jgi:hypothetical protein